MMGKTNTPEFGAGANTRNAVYGATGNPFDPHGRRPDRRAARRWRWPCGMVPLCTGSAISAAACATRRRFAASSGFGPPPDWWLRNQRPRLVALAGAGPMARNGGRYLRCCCRRWRPMIARDPLATTVHGRTGASPGGFLAAGADRPGGAACGADAGFRLCPDRARTSPRCSPRRRRCSATFSRAPTMPRRIAAAADEAFEVLRALGFAGGASRTRCAPGREEVGPNVRANVAEGLRYSAAGRGPRASPCRPRCTGAGRVSSATTT